MSVKVQTLSISEARKRTPPVDAAEAMRKQLSLAMFDSVSEKDVAALVAKLKEMAQGGDLKAMKMFFELVTQQGKADRENEGIKMMALAMQDLVDEIRIAKSAARPKVLTHDDDDDD